MSSLSDSRDLVLVRIAWNHSPRLTNPSYATILTKSFSPTISISRTSTIAHRVHVSPRKRSIPDSNIFCSADCLQNIGYNLWEASVLGTHQEADIEVIWPPEVAYPYLVLGQTVHLLAVWLAWDSVLSRFVTIGHDYILYRGA